RPARGGGGHLLGTPPARLAIAGGGGATGQQRRHERPDKHPRWQHARQRHEDGAYHRSVDGARSLPAAGCASRSPANVTVSIRSSAWKSRIVIALHDEAPRLPSRGLSTRTTLSFHRSPTAGGTATAIAASIPFTSASGIAISTCQPRSVSPRSSSVPCTTTADLMPLVHSTWCFCARVRGNQASKWAFRGLTCSST